MLTMNPAYGYDGSLKTITPAFTPRQSVFFMPMAWTRAENTQYQPKHVLFAFSESTPLSFLTALLRKITQMTKQIVSFNNHNIESIQYNNQSYMTKDQIGLALEYADTDKISHLYNAHKSEFDEDMTCLIKRGRTRVRVFNREGAWLIGMFARTPKAAEFRKWVLKVLGAVADNQVAPVPSLTQDKSALKVIGGLVKKCAAVAVRDEIQATIREEVRNTAINIILAAEKFKPLQEVTDDMMLRCLYNWYSTRHHKLLDTVKSVTEENSMLKSKLEIVKKTVN